jgi:hypothetical protein
MDVDEAEVWVRRDGHGRAAIVRRTDGFFCIYLWHYFAESIPVALLYEDPDYPELYAKPQPGIYGTVEDARRELRSLTGFSDAILKVSNTQPPANT